MAKKKAKSKKTAKKTSKKKDSKSLAIPLLESRNMDSEGEFSLDTLIRAERIKSDKKLMKFVQKAKKKREEALKSV